MPPTTDKIPEKIPHDLYGTLVILTFLFTAGASWMLYDNLTKEWAYGVNKPRPERSEHITRLNNDPATHPELIDVTKEDLEDWVRAAKHYYGKDQDFPLQPNEWHWPQGFDIYKNPIKPNADNTDPNVLPAEQHDKFMLNYNAAAPVAPVAPAPDATKPAAAPAPDATKPAAAPAPDAAKPAAAPAPDATKPAADAPKPAADAPKPAEPAK